MEFLIVIAFFGYIFYLAKYADLRSQSEKEKATLPPVQSDFQKEEDSKVEPATTYLASKTKQPLFDKRLLASTLLVLATSSIIVYVIEDAEGIHLPYLVAVFSAISIGFAEPYRGWMLAILQCVLIYLGYHFFATPPEGSALKELHNFSLYGSMILTFAGSFLGAFMKRALNMK